MDREILVGVHITPEIKDQINIIAERLAISKVTVLEAVDALENCQKAFEELSSIDWEEVSEKLTKLKFEIKKYHVNEDFNLNKKIYIVEGPVGVNPQSRRYKSKRRFN